MQFYFLHDSKGEVTSRTTCKIPLTEGMELYSAVKLEVSGEQYSRADADFCYVDINSASAVFPDARPSEDHSFDYATKQWVAEISDQKATKWTEIKVARNAEEFSTFAWNSHAFQCDERSQSRIVSAVQRAQLDAALTMVWTLSDNSTVSLNATELKQVGQALSSHIDACHVKARGLRGQIDAAETEAELDLITW